MPRNVAAVALALLVAGAPLSSAQTPTQSPPPAEQPKPAPEPPLVEPLPAPPKYEDNFSGTMYFDYFYNVRGTGSVVKDSSGFQIRRAYFTYDRPLAQDFSFRFRLEANDAERTSRNGNDSKISVFVKQASVEWRRALIGATLQMGIAPTPLLDNIEKAWGYRSVEEANFDLHNFGATTDLGLGVRGSVAGSKILHYHGMFGNGSFQSPENDRHHRGYLGVWVDKAPFLVEAVGDIEGGPGRENRYSLKGMAAHMGATGAFGAEAYLHVQKAPSDALEDLKPVGATVFARGRLTDHWGALGRVDYFDPDANSDTGWREYLLIAGYDYQPIDPVHLIPNAEITLYDPKGSGPTRKSDVVLRLTLFLLFD